MSEVAEYVNAMVNLQRLEREERARAAEAAKVIEQAVSLADSKRGPAVAEFRQKQDRAHAKGVIPVALHGGGLAVARYLEPVPKGRPQIEILHVLDTRNSGDAVALHALATAARGDYMTRPDA